MKLETLSLITMAAAMAQDPGPALTARILEVHMDKVRPDRWLAYKHGEAGAAAACATHGCPKPYLTLTSVTGEPEVWQISTWERFGVMENGGDRYEGPAKSHRLRDTVEQTSTVLAVYREDLSGRPAVSLPSMRYFSIAIVQTRPGKAPDFERMLHLARSPGALDHRFVYQVVSGMPAGTFIMVTPMRYLRESEERRPSHGLLLDASVRKAASKLFLSSPELSYPPREWFEVEGAFWNVTR